MTEYQVDGCKAGESGQGSASRREAKIWDKILDCLWNRAFIDYPDLTLFEVSLSFDRSNLPKMSEAHALANEIAVFLHVRSSEIEQQKTYHRFGHRPSDGDFNAHPTLKKFVNRISALRTDVSYGNRVWQLADATHIGIITDEIAAIIKEKAEKFHKYDFAEMDEGWLLICASGAGSSSRAGSLSTQKTQLTSEELCECARSASFDRIIFWERIAGWDFDFTDGCRPN